MSSIQETRKLKRWLVLTRPHVITLSQTSYPIYYANLTPSYTQLVSPIAIGDSTATFADYTSNGTLYRVPTLASGDVLTINYGLADQESVVVDSMINKVLTIQGTFTKDHPAGLTYVCGGFHAKLAQACSSGDDQIVLNFAYGLNVGDQLCLGYSAGATAEIVKIEAISGTTITLDRMLYFDHTVTEKVEFVPESANVGSGSTRTIYDTVSSGTTKLSSSKRIPWIQEAETLSFPEAREIAKTLAYVIGLENVRISRVVDLDSDILPVT